MTNWNKKYAIEIDLGHSYEPDRYSDNLTKLQNIIHEIRGHHEVINEMIGALHHRLGGLRDHGEILKALEFTRNHSEDNAVEMARQLDAVNEYLKKNAE